MYRMVTEVDETCGKILDKLKEQGVLDNTLVIFTTDNGNMHGKTAHIYIFLSLLIYYLSPAFSYMHC